MASSSGMWTSAAGSGQYSGTHAIESRVDEKLGVCDGIAIDFNGDHILSPRFLESRPPMNVNFSKEDDWDATDTLYDYDEWGNLKLNFRLGRGWNAN